MRVLDVGAGYSDLPAYLTNSCNVEGWVADDFGATDKEKIWSRWGDPRQLPEKYPGVHYVFRNLGEPTDELPLATFDRVYSVSVLEHVPAENIEAVLLHMAQLLKPGGLMLHTVDLPFPRTVTRPGLSSLARFLAKVGARKLLVAVRAPGHRPFTKSVEGWAKLLKRLFSLQGKLDSISTMQMVLDQDVVIEPTEVVYRFYPPNDQPKPYWRVVSLAFILRRL
jgi:SAM-dependent methyltransferase